MSTKIKMIIMHNILIKIKVKQKRNKLFNQNNKQWAFSNNKEY